MTHYSFTTLQQIFPDKGDALSFATMDTQAPIIGKSKMVTTIRITSASDEALGDAQPQFEVVDFTQEQM